MFRLTIFHELGHIICESFNKDAANLCERLYNNSKIKNRLNEFGITNKNILLNGFVLLEDVLVNEVAEDVLYRSKESLRPGFCYYKNDSFPGVKYRSNYNLYKRLAPLTAESGSVIILEYISFFERTI